MDAQDTDLSELLWGLWRHNPDAGAEGHVRTLFDSLCAGVCAEPPPPLPAQWVSPETFEALTEEELELEGFKREMLGEGGVSDGNMMQYLGIIEQRTNEILQLYAVSQSTQHGEGGNTLASLLGQGPRRLLVACRS